MMPVPPEVSKEVKTVLEQLNTVVAQLQEVANRLAPLTGEVDDPRSTTVTTKTVVTPPKDNA